jgi:hypothetical protein
MLRDAQHNWFLQAVAYFGEKPSLNCALGVAADSSRLSLISKN